MKVRLTSEVNKYLIQFVIRTQEITSIQDGSDKPHESTNSQIALLVTQACSGTSHALHIYIYEYVIDLSEIWYEE